MARPKLVSPDQPFWLRTTLRIVEFSASLKLAVLLILAMAFIFALGTVVEAAWGTPAAQFGTYQTWWFNLCLILLAINIFAAAAVRFPWKRYQTGFVITHLGLLVLLAGAAMGRIYGIDAQIFVYELGADHRAYADDLHFRLTVHSQETIGNPNKNAQTIEFKPGVFSWRDYSTMFRFNQPEDRSGLEGWMWKTFRAFGGWMFAIADRTRAGDVLYNRDGVKLEVLDYYADSRQVSAPMIQVMMALPTTQRMTADGRSEEAPTQWAPFQLSVNPAPKQADQYPNGLGARELAGGGHLSFWLAGSEDQVKAFLNGGPEGDLGEKGQVVLWANGKKHHFLVHEKIDQGRFGLPGSDLEVELAAYWPRADLDRELSREGKFVWVGDPDAESPDHPAVKLTVFKDDKPSGELILFAKSPDDNIHDYKNRVFGDYWFDPPQTPHEQANRAPIITGGGSRIDIIQGPGEKLYYRYWRRSEKKLEFARELPANGSPETAVPAFIMPAGQQKLYVQEFIGSDKPVANKVLPLPFDREKNIGVRQPAALVRLTVDDHTEEFWILGYIGPPEETPRHDSQHRTVFGKDRFVSLIMPVDSVDIGFRTRLSQFSRKLDPGTSQPSHYSSTIDIIDRHRDRTVFAAALDGRRPVDIKAPTPKTASDIASISSLAFDSRQSTLYWIDPLQRTIQRVAVDGGKIADVVEGLIETGLRDPQDLVVDSAAKSLFWCDYEVTRSGNRGLIHRADLDGANAKVVATFSGTPTVLALDPERQKIYWLDPWRGAIGRVNYDGQDLEEDFIRGLDQPGGIAVDPATQHIFWTEQREGVIRRASLDGEDERVVVVQEQHERPFRIAVDSTAGKIYWTDIGEGEIVHRENGPSVPERFHKVRRADLNGESVEDVVTRGVHNPGDLAVSSADGRLFWAQDAVYRRDVWITMNAPIEFSDPITRRRYRIFQEAFNGPWKPGDPQFEANVPASSEKTELYQSVLTVNYDPGRPVRNAGCLLVVLGIATMFYMRAYFITGKRTTDAVERAAPVVTDGGEKSSSKKGRKRKSEPVV